MNKQEQQDFTLDQIIENSFDFSGYTEEEKRDLIGETSGMIMETALLRSLGEADETLQKKFDTFLKSEPNAEAMSQFIEDNFPNFGEIVVEEIKLFQEDGMEKGEESEE